MTEPSATTADPVPTTAGGHAPERSDPQALLTLSGVVHEYGSVCTIGPLDLQVIRGELLVVSGPVKSGKSVLMRVLAGLERPRQGALSIGGENPGRLRGSARALLRRSMGLLPALPPFLEERSALDNAALPALIAGHTAREAHDRAKAALKLLGWPDDGPFDRSARQFARGERQQIAIARALVNRPALLLLDDLCEGLDDMQSAVALAAVEQYCAAGVGAVVFQRAVTPEQPPRAGLVWPARSRHVWLGADGVHP